MNSIGAGRKSFFNRVLPLALHTLAGILECSSAELKVTAVGLPVCLTVNNLQKKATNPNQFFFMQYTEIRC